MKNKIIAGNWKMNKTREATHEFFRAFSEKTLRTDRDVIFCPPYTNIAIAREYAEELGFVVGAQNFAMPTKGGAMTGEISAEMLVELGVGAVLVGHSERRLHFGETNSMTAQKCSEALTNGLMPILCIGETLQERESGNMESVLRDNLAPALHLPKDKFIVAYEPVWAIGTGKVATVEQINETHKFIKSVIGADVPVLYGGSVNDGNAKEILALENVDGVLVGGASLDPDKFTTIINA